MDAIATYLNLPPIQVYEVASFYSMFETHPCGRHHVSVSPTYPACCAGPKSCWRMWNSAWHQSGGEHAGRRIFLSRKKNACGLHRCADDDGRSRLSRELTTTLRSHP